MDTPKLPVPFEPVPVRPRRDGWTIERQIAFVEKLADCGSVSAAAKHVGMSRESARQLRRRFGARSFRDAWDAALDCNYAELEEAAAQRAKTGVARPVSYKGEKVGEWRYFDERLTMFLLRFRRRHRFGPEAEAAALLPRGFVDGEDGLIRFDPEGEFDGCLDAYEFRADPGFDEIYDEEPEAE